MGSHYVRTMVTCDFDSDKNGKSDGGNCPSFRSHCGSNLHSDIDKKLNEIKSNEVVDNDDFLGFKDIAQKIIDDRVFNTNHDTSHLDDGIVDHAIIDRNHLNKFNNWVGGFSTTGSTIMANGASVLDRAPFDVIADKLKQIASMCNDINHSDCPSVCACNSHCTCNCHSNY